MITLHAIRNIVTGLIIIGQQFLIDTSGAESSEVAQTTPVGATGLGEEAAATTPKKRGPKPKGEVAAPAQESAASTPEKKADAGIPVTRDMIRSAFGGYMAIPNVGQEKGKKLLADFGFQKLSEVPDEKLAELHALVQTTALAAAAPDPFAA